MKRSFSLSALFLALFFIGFVASHCDSSSSSTDDEAADDGDEEDGQPALVEADFPDVTPCVDRDTLPDDATFQATLAAADNVMHRHIPYSDDDSLGAVCGLAGEWDPEDATEVEDVIFDDEVADFIDFHFFAANMTEICRSDFGFDSGDTDPGFVAAGTYRGDACIEDGDDVYEFRLRTTVSGDAADETFAANGIDEAGDLAIFDADGNALVTPDDVKDSIGANPESFSFTVGSADGATTYLEVSIETICVKVLDEPCPEET